MRLAIDRTERGADDAIAKARDHRLDLGAIDHARADIATLVVHAMQECGPLLEFLVAEAERKAAALLQRDIDAGEVAIALASSGQSSAEVRVQCA